MTRINGSDRPVSKIRVAVIGAGMSGVLAAIKLKEAGIDDFVVLEKGKSVGGTWRENHYPGLHCDFPSHFYCYSFYLNPNWTRKFSPGPEIREYLEDAARHFGVFESIKFNTKVVETEWGGAHWNLTTEHGATIEADVVIAATGFLHVPRYPNISGLETFGGAQFHTTKWDHSIPLEDKRIGLIGSGSTGTQIISALAGNVKQLKAFIRTPQWVAKVENFDFSEEEKEAFAADFSLMRTMYAEEQVEMVKLADGAVQGRDPEMRAWLVNNVKENLATVADPELRRKLTPNYEPGCKRLVMSPNFYQAIQDPTCEVVTEQILRVEPGGIRTDDGALHEIDVLVLATGYDTQAYFRPMKVVGENGTNIEKIWDERPIAYKSIAVPNMPNFFMVEGPFSPIGNVAVPVTIELQIGYIVKCIDHIFSERIALSPRRDKTDEMVSRYREAAKSTIYATGLCSSWYLDAEGVPTIYPFTCGEFEADMKNDPALDDYVVRPLLQEETI